MFYVWVCNEIGVGFCVQLRLRCIFFCPQMSNGFSTMVEQTALLFNHFCAFVNSCLEIFNYRFNFLIVLGLIRLSSSSCGVWQFEGCEKFVHFFYIVKFWSAWNWWLMSFLFLCKSVLLEIYQCYWFFFKEPDICFIDFFSIAFLCATSLISALII